MYLITYVVFGVVLAVLALALHGRLSSSASALMQVATAVGLMGAVVLVASGMVFNGGMAAVVDVYPANADQAQAMWARDRDAPLDCGFRAAERSIAPEPVGSTASL